MLLLFSFRPSFLPMQLNNVYFPVLIVDVVSMHVTIFAHLIELSQPHVKTLHARHKHAFPQTHFVV